jgi:hypothetical protein
VTTLLTHVRDAVAAVQEHFADHPVEILPDGDGGVFVVIDDIEIGTHYIPETTWLGFQINAAFPQSDVYPHYIGRVERRDGQPHGEGVQAVDWQSRPALQLSRRSNRWNPAIDTPALKAEKVITWFTTK